MSIKNQVRLFECNTISELEDQINEWLNENNNVFLIDIKFNHSMSHYRPTTCTAMIIYQDMGDEKEK